MTTRLFVSASFCHSCTSTSALATSTIYVYLSLLLSILYRLPYVSQRLVPGLRFALRLSAPTRSHRSQSGLKNNKNDSSNIAHSVTPYRCASLCVLFVHAVDLAFLFFNPFALLQLLDGPRALLLALRVRALCVTVILQVRQMKPVSMERIQNIDTRQSTESLHNVETTESTLLLDWGSSTQSWKSKEEI